MIINSAAQPSTAQMLHKYFWDEQNGYVRVHRIILKLEYNCSGWPMIQSPKYIGLFILHFIEFIGGTLLKQLGLSYFSVVTTEGFTYQNSQIL